MNKVYDNGTMVLGSVENVRTYLLENMEYYEEDELEIKNILEDIDELGNDYIVAINYDFGMGYAIDYWHNKDDVVRESEEE